jgi:hypothetical protein
MSLPWPAVRPPAWVRAWIRVVLPLALMRPGRTTAPTTEIGLLANSTTCTETVALARMSASSSVLSFASIWVEVRPATCTRPMTFSATTPSSLTTVRPLMLASSRTLMSSTSRGPTGASDERMGSSCALANDARTSSARTSNPRDFISSGSRENTAS